MARNIAVVCDGCGGEIPGGQLVHSLQMQVYHRDGSGRIEALEFSWDDGDLAADPVVPSCGARAIAALRAEFAKPEMGTKNENTGNPLLPNSTEFVRFISPIPDARAPQPAVTTPETPVEPAP